MPSQPKKMLIVAVLETLRKYTDEHHRLMQAPLLVLLEKDYGLKVDRKSLRHNIEDLINAGYPLKYQRGWYYKHEFTRDEVNIIARSLIENLSLPAETISRLICKVKALVPDCQDAPLSGTESETLLALEEALLHGTPVSFSASGKTVSGVVPTKIERDGKASLLSSSGPEEEPARQETWTVTVQDANSRAIHTYPLSSITDLTVPG